MTRATFTQLLHDVFGNTTIAVEGNFVILTGVSEHLNQQHTNEAFTEKWQKYEQSDEKERLYQYQRDWYLKLYGFGTETALAQFLRSKKIILDAGCGLGYKAAWFAELAPHALVIGMDFSDAVCQAALDYVDLPNLFFIQGDIANT